MINKSYFVVHKFILPLKKFMDSRIILNNTFYFARKDASKVSVNTFMLQLLLYSGIKDLYFT